MTDPNMYRLLITLPIAKTSLVFKSYRTQKVGEKMNLI